MSDINITLRGEIVGSVTFDQPDKALGGVRTASGFRLYLPATITFHPPQDQSPLLLENLQATLSASNVEIGVARYPEALRSVIGKRSFSFVWDWTMVALVVYERIRAGHEPEFSITLSGEIRYLLSGQGWKEVCSIESAFHEPGVVRYSREAWANTLRAMNLRDSILVEIPFKFDPPSGWEPVWQALRDARDSFDQGGSTGWKNCVNSVRHALEEWQNIEKEEQGPGWQRPSSGDLRGRTKEHRMDNLRWHLIQCAHLAPHTNADDWTRDDALLALSTVCALLAVRKP
jgi:hypothetical protein